MPRGPSTRLLTAACALACTAAIAACGDSYERPSGADLGGTTTTGRAAESRERGRTAAESRRAARARRAARKRGSAGGGHSRPLPGRAKAEVALIRSLVDQLVEGLRDRDPSSCTRLFSQRHVDRARREDLIANCKRGIARAPTDIKLARIEVMEIYRGRKATTGVVQFVTIARGRRQRHRFHLARSGRAYKVDAVYRVKQPAR